MVSLLHAADIHLGSQFPALRNKADEYRHQLIKTFEKIVILAGEEKVSLLLIAGDLFDTNRVYGLTVGKVVSEFKKLDELGIRVCVIPGTHDPFSQDSVYRSLAFPSNVTLFTPEYGHKTYPDLDLTVYGMVPETKDWDKSPLDNVVPVAKSTFHIGMAHCSVKLTGQENQKGTIDKNEIAASGFDYLALGHWHSFMDVSQGNTAACYCGSPEPIERDQKGAGNVVRVTIERKGKVEFQPVYIGTKKCASVTLDISPFESMDAISRVIAVRSDPNLILDVALKGLSKIDSDLNVREIEDGLYDKFFDLHIADNTHLAMETIKSESYPDKTVIGRYLNIMEEKIAAAENEQDRSLYEESLKLGLALLKGRLQEIE